MTVPKPETDNVKRYHVWVGIGDWASSCDCESDEQYVIINCILVRDNEGEEAMLMNSTEYVQNSREPIRS